ncbi:5502_t:CDS:2 [Ambispora leptoticha]|uniref:5502_t:CDS:1 n=1 Tax=Ambispora leptoticha TaxID=144679 RepID=A0A9N8W0D6_9GLOM|nr:5502_t:CDS:2 [Ambispora leptoticha]
MLSKIKTWVPPFGRLLQSIGAKELKPNTSPSNAVSRSLGSNQRPLIEIQQQRYPAQAPQQIHTHEKLWLREFISEKIPIVKAFSPFPPPLTLVGCNKPATSKLLFGGTTRTFAANNLAFERFLPGHGFAFGRQRSFCSAPQTMVAHFANNGGNLLQVVGKSFYVAAKKNNASFLQSNVQNNNEKPQIVNSNKIVKTTTTPAKKTESLQPLSPIKSIGLVDIIQQQQKGSESNEAKVIHSVYLKETIERDTTEKKILEEMITSVDDNVQVYISFNMNLKIGSLKSKSGITLDPSFIQTYDNVIKRQHQVILDILEKLSRLNKVLDIQFLDFELRVVFPRGMDIKKVRELLTSLGIDLDDPVLSLSISKNVAKSLDNINQSSIQNLAEQTMNSNNNNKRSERPLTLPFAHPSNLQSHRETSKKRSSSSYGNSTLDQTQNLNFNNVNDDHSLEIHDFLKEVNEFSS